MKLRALTILTALAITGGGFVVIACSGDDDDGDQTTTQPTATSPAAAAPTNTQPPAAAATTAPAPGGPISMTIADLLFNPDRITARAGQPVTINLRNTGALPHTFTITGLTGADSNTINGGGTGSVTFTPTAAGSLTFFCKIHGQTVMAGTLTVTQ